MRKRALPVVGLALATVSIGIDAAPSSHGAAAWRWSGEAGLLVQDESALDSGGGMRVDRFFAEAGGSGTWAERWRLGVSVGYGEDDYAFSGSSGFGGLDPWERVRDLRLGARLRYALTDAWTVYANPSLRFTAERGASLDDGRTAGLLAGAGYRVSDRLTIGPGFGVFSEIEDDTSVFPILVIDWKITDRLSLETGRGFAASRGPGLQLRWTHSEHWQFAAGARYEKNRFRLDDDGIAPGGVGEDTAVPVFVLAEYRLSPGARLSVFGGAEIDGRLRLEDASGRKVDESDLSSAPFLGASFQVSF